MPIKNNKFRQGKYEPFAMLKNQNIICISSIDWDFIWQQHQAIMSKLAKNGNRVLFIENTGIRPPAIKDFPRLKKRLLNWLRSTKGFRQERENLYIYSPLIIPFPYLRLARWINHYLFFKSISRWMRAADFYDPIIWIFLPTPLALAIVDKIEHKAIVYYCTDNFAATSRGAKRVVKYEKKVLKKSDVVFVMAKNMLQDCKDFNQNTTCIPMGVDTEVFLKSDAYGVPEELKGIKSPIVGFIGGVRGSIDKGLIAYLAKNLDSYTFVFVGPLQMDISELKRFKNIIFTGQIEHAELPKYISSFNACIIPYIKNEYTDNISAAKLNEYLIMGKPVISVALNEIENFNRENGGILYLASSYTDFAAAITMAIKEDSDTLKNQRVKVACDNSWDRKIEQMSEIIYDAIAKKKILEENWQLRLLKMYKRVVRNTKRAFTVLLISWVLVFYTPFIWFLAEPLKISQKPKKADAIVVFAGGVGESGQAGQGYEERVQYANELYKAGYAKYIIFSSGYMYTFKEPVMMKMLAESLRVPAEAIILEDRAKNTFENVDFTSQILAQKGWKEILLVSSPYHMRRASLVFNKIAKDIKVKYLPIPDSLFYAHPEKDIYGRRIWKRINLRQAKGVIHEYLGILYYWWKGWI